MKMATDKIIDIAIILGPT